MRIARGRAEGKRSEQRSERFSGEVWADAVMTPGDGVGVNNVFFTPGSRTHWHSHEGGQYLFVTVGRGLVCAEGKRQEIIEVGDSVWALAGERHWHGAAADSCLQHHAVSIGVIDWMEPVSDDEYSAADQSA